MIIVLKTLIRQFSDVIKFVITCVVVTFSLNILQILRLI